MKFDSTPTNWNYKICSSPSTNWITNRIKIIIKDNLRPSAPVEAFASRMISVVHTSMTVGAEIFTCMHRFQGNSCISNSTASYSTPPVPFLSLGTSSLFLTKFKKMEIFGSRCLSQLQYHKDSTPISYRWGGRKRDSHVQNRQSIYRVWKPSHAVQQGQKKMRSASSSTIQSRNYFIRSACKTKLWFRSHYQQVIRQCHYALQYVYRDWAISQHTPGDLPCINSTREEIGLRQATWNLWHIINPLPHQLEH